MISISYIVPLLFILKYLNKVESPELNWATFFIAHPKNIISSNLDPKQKGNALDKSKSFQEYKALIATIKFNKIQCNFQL